MDLRGMKDMPAGPYQVSFELNTSARGTGDIFFTTDGKTVLPRGENKQFPVYGTDSPQPVRVELKTDKRLHQLRIDVSDGEGAAEIAKLRLLGSGGKVIKDWRKVTRERHAAAYSEMPGHFPLFQMICVPLLPGTTMSFQPLPSRSWTRIWRPMPGPLPAGAVEMRCLVQARFFGTQL